MKKFDLVVIGSGVGLMLIEAALQNGMRCAVIEKSKFGGTCLTKGCIPSKMLVYPADLIREAQNANKVGLEFAAPKIDWEKISGRMWKQIGYNGNIEKSLMKADNLTVYKGTGEFVSPKTMKVMYDGGGYSDEFEGSKFIIAAGARSFIPPIDGLEQTGYLVYETFFGDKYPAEPWKSLAIIGCGAIGAELAHIFSSMGTKVTVIEMNKRILPAEEEEISEFVKTQFKENNIDVFTGTRAVSASKSEAGKTVIIEDIASGIKTNINCDEIFIASGIRSNGDLLKLNHTNIEVDSKGWIITNEFLETSQRDIWALGDINGKYQFRHKANHEAEILTNNLFGHDKKKKEMSYSAVPWAIFTSPQVAHIGMTEREVKSKGLKHRIGRNFYSEVVGGIAMGYSHHDTDDGFVKIIVSEDKKILGVHIVGPHASILLQPFAYLMNSGQKCNANKQSLFGRHKEKIQELRIMCPNLGTYLPINDSMVIHPSLSELTAWVIDKIDWENDDE
ncbi:MAG: dihydrolipoyl dehydrogenase family protein [Eubacteriales bacterium]